MERHGIINGYVVGPVLNTIFTDTYSLEGAYVYLTQVYSFLWVQMLFLSISYDSYIPIYGIYPPIKPIRAFLFAMFMWLF